jgi:hypothetical protein
MHFSLDRDDAAHRIRIEKEVAGQRQPVHDLAELAAFGYRETVMVNGKPTIYTLSEDDLQTLYALKSMNPVVEDDVHVSRLHHRYWAICARRRISPRVIHP